MGRVMTQNSNNAANNPDGPKPAENAHLLKEPRTG
jgi:hypothetical protein